MGRGCLIIFAVVAIVILMGGGYLLKITGGDPLAIGFFFADRNGDISNWEDRTAKIVKISRTCEVGHDEDLTASDCASNVSLENYLVRRYGKSESGKNCAEDISFNHAKVCYGQLDGPTNGLARVFVEGRDSNYKLFRACIPFSSRDRGFYFFQVGDLIKVNIYSPDHSIGRLPLGDRNNKC